MSSLERMWEGKGVLIREVSFHFLVISLQLKLSDFGMARILDEQTGVYNLSNLQSRIPISW